MSLCHRALLCCAGVGLLLSSNGCALVPRSRLAACQDYNAELLRRNQAVCAQYESLRAQNEELANRTRDAEERLASQQDLVGQFQSRTSQWDQERERMERAYASLLDQGRGSPLPRDVRSKLEDFAARHPEFVELDAEAGISKFKSDVLFPSGQAILLPDSESVLREFAAIFRDGSGRPLQIMIVGHTDERPIAKPGTRERHETNWHLSAHRAIAVEQYLEQAGIEPTRMGVIGYGRYQPVDLGRSADSLARNRRVEIFVLAPDAPIVGRTESLPNY